MRWTAVVVTVVVCLGVTVVRADTPVAPAAPAAPATPPAPPSKCDQCSDLCQLVDQYEQKQKIEELFRQYAEVSVGGEQQTLPLNDKGEQVSSMYDFESAVQREFDEWTKHRVLPCQHPPFPAAGASALSDSRALANAAKGGAPSGSSTQLETTMFHEKDTDPPACQVMYDHAPLTPDTIPKFESQYNCKPITNALQEHEQVHVKQCQRAYAAMPGEAGAAFLNDPRNVANGEMKAYGREKEIVADQIRRIVKQKGCGWHPTKAQEKNPNALPSHDQITNMSDRGWKAVKALGGKGRK